MFAEAATATVLPLRPRVNPVTSATLPPLATHDRWAASVGRFVLSFGSIERAVNRAVVEWAAADARPERASASLSYKLHLLLGRIEKVAMPVSYRAEIRRCLTQAESMVGYLNFVCHSPFALIAFPTRDLQPQPSQGPAIEQADIEKLEEFTTCAEQVAHRLSPLLVLVHLYQADGIERDIVSRPPRAAASPGRPDRHLRPI